MSTKKQADYDTLSLFVNNLATVNSIQTAVVLLPISVKKTWNQVFLRKSIKLEYFRSDILSCVFSAPVI